MMEGWYCRTIANQRTGGQQEDQNVNVDDDSGSDDSQTVQKPENDRAKQTNGDQVDYKAQYRYLKRKLKFLIYENEFFQDALRSNQRRLLKVSRDRAFLLDRLMQYEKPDDTSDSDVTESSEDEAKKRKTEPTTATAAVTANAAAAPTTGATRGRKRKAPGGDTTKPHKTVMVEKKTTEAQMVAAPLNQQNQPQQSQQHPSTHQPRQMTQAEVERHLQSRQTVLEMMPEQATATVPHEMFSNEPSLDGETQEQIIDESPQHVAAEECVAMEYAN